MSSLGTATQPPPSSPEAETEVEADLDVGTSSTDDVTIALVSSEPGPRRRGRPPIDGRNAYLGPERVRQATDRGRRRAVRPRG